MAALTSMAVELIDHITTYCDTGVCYSLLTTCRRINHIVERNLYREITLKDAITVSFVRALYHTASEDRRIRCSMVRKLTLRCHSPTIMAYANPGLASLIRLMPNVRALDISADGTAGDMLHMFLCRSGVVRQNGPHNISTLAPINDGSKDTPLALQALRTLTVSGNFSFVKLIHGREVEEITYTSVTNINITSGAQNLLMIRGDGPAYTSLRCLSLAVFLASTTELIQLMDELAVVAPQLEDLDVRLFSIAVLSEDSDVNDLSWLRQLPDMALRKLSLRGNLGAMLPTVTGKPDDFAMIPKTVGHHFWNSLTRLNELEINRSRWVKEPSGWAFSMLPFVSMLPSETV